MNSARSLLDMAATTSTIEVGISDAYTILSEAHYCFTPRGRRGATRLALRELQKARDGIDSLIAELEPLSGGGS